MIVATLPTQQDLQNAVATVDDPEYPGVSIVDLGLFEAARLSPEGDAQIDLIPTFSGCPALAMIADEVQNAVAALPGVKQARVRWLPAPVWTIERVTNQGRQALAQEFTVAVQIGSTTICPRCGEPTTEKSPFGASRCRAIHVCSACAEVVEVLRG
ncbi:MAG TPA: DUF59 domain-containing protein [Acidimicrobiia bacterium]|jgi:ring-1,2-phenylacetyl-CoA epoxidase subunit PaaD|nr:DUF59 domain-containing protein [Acidimicrobiia bacterium]HIL46118.1 DUF59 domain-containing protein [Acidimicrobiia bacterium]